MNQHSRAIFTLLVFFMLLGTAQVVEGILLQKEFFREKRYTCSSFIARVLEENGLKLFSKHFSLVTPKDFYELEQKEVIYEGELKQLICMEQYRTEIA